MNRRHFCKIASLAAASLGLSRLESQAKTLSLSPLPALPRACRISIVRREFHPDLQTIFLDDPDSGPCPLFTSGSEFCFEADTGCPDGFCPQLWATVCNTLSRLPGQLCARPLESSTLLLACPDGTRPVIVRVDLE